MDEYGRKSWEDAVAPTWGWTIEHRVDIFRGFEDATAYLISGVENIGCVVLGGFIRDKTLPMEPDMYYMQYRFQINQLFWTGTDAAEGESFFNGSLGRLVEIKDEPDTEYTESYNAWAPYTVGYKVEDGKYVGGPACSWDEMIEGISHVITKECRKNKRPINERMKAQRRWNSKSMMSVAMFGTSY